MLLEAIYHRPKQNWAYAYDGKTIHLRVRTGRRDVERVEAIVGDKYAWEQTADTVPMRLFASDERFDYWETFVVPPFRRLRYAFLLTSGGERLLLTEKGFEEKVPDHCLTFFDFPFLNPVDVFEPPAWVKDAVFYQIFPERFANGDPSLNPEGVEPWGGKPTPSNFFGGDLQGVIDHLDHLARLGVNAIYFTPLFEATTNHKYDTQDYLKVDPQFGSNEKLKELVDICHSRGIRVLLDAVFNHSGRTFQPFVDARENGQSSKYADWFHVREWPLQVVDGVPTYETFAFEPLMPKLNTENPEVKAYLFEVARYWLEEIGIDGWRLDVANEVDHQFWREFRAVVKGVNPEAYILGEIWHDSMMWLQGDQFDAVMNYPFTNAALDFFAYGKGSASAFASAIGAQLAAYPQQVTESAFNLLDSHDTPRLLSLCGDHVGRLKLAALFQMTYPGTPCIYYGDEVGMNGEGDPDCRKCMVWEPHEQDAALFGFYQDAIGLRHEFEAMRGSDIAFLHAGDADGLLAYERRSDGQRLLIAMNASEEDGEIACLPSHRDAAAGSRAVFAIPFRGFKAAGSDAEAVDGNPEEVLASEEVVSLSSELPNAGIDSLNVPTEWKVVFSSEDAYPVGSILSTGKDGVLPLALGGFGYVVLRQV
ncbi:glycoside hydrolase family 13 protein [Paenibacillus sp. LHD-117]|uniref:glycoside hydrolase family 13 protein n=1 Tax=Paenibacillus sp. LHD-117 TaxID=3071412 RepID=UPI0027DF7126|nr:glycoside hydrolase family 13 protein [Paenibacillus sp. LHD-117]MDQ6423153.1 glycoside hydrolase family 13 protein [Paenibacillus sp. LHD-117]